MTQLPTSITIRRASPDDRAALVRLAALDSAAAAPPTPVLLAEVEGELHAAISLRDGSVVADPFHPTADLVALLRLRAKGVTRRDDSRSLRSLLAAPPLRLGARLS